MGSLEKRLETLEEHIGSSEGMGPRDWQTSEKRAELIAEIERLSKLHGDKAIEPRRMTLLQEIEEYIERRRRSGA